MVVMTDRGRLFSFWWRTKLPCCNKNTGSYWRCYRHFCLKASIKDRFGLRSHHRRLLLLLLLFSSPSPFFPRALENLEDLFEDLFVAGSATSRGGTAVLLRAFPIQGVEGDLLLLPVSDRLSGPGPALPGELPGQEELFLQRYDRVLTGVVQGLDVGGGLEEGAQSKLLKR